MWLIFHLIDIFARITLNIMEYDDFYAMGYILVQKLDLYGKKYISFENLKNRVEGMLKWGKWCLSGSKGQYLQPFTPNIGPRT